MYDQDKYAEEDAAYYDAYLTGDPEEQGIRQEEQLTAQRRVDKLMTIAKEKLTAKQLQAFTLLGVECLTQEEAAGKMRVTQQVVSEHWEKARSILEKEYAGVFK